MWSHYADNHKGFVLVYDKKDLAEAKPYTKKEQLTFSKTKLEKVRYVDKQKDMTQAVLSYIRFNMLPNMGILNLVMENFQLRICEKYYWRRRQTGHMKKNGELFPEFQALKLNPDYII